MRCVGPVFVYFEEFGGDILGARGVDARSRVTMFNNYPALQYIHVGAIEAVVGLVKRGRQLGIIDQPSEFAKPVFVRNEELDEDLRQV